MKIYLLVLLQIVSLLSYGQIPVIQSNTNVVEQNKSTIQNLFTGQYDLLIAYSEDCYWWSNKQDYQLLAVKEGKWCKLNVSSRKKKNGDFTKPTITHTRIDNRSGELLLKQFNEIEFWALDRDSLNITTKQVNDSVSTNYSLSDGVNYKFEILTKESYKIIEAYEPEYFLTRLPEFKQRQTFIIARNLYKTIIKDTGT
jgi:hypothetical protein